MAIILYVGINCFYDLKVDDTYIHNSAHGIVTEIEYQLNGNNKVIIKTDSNQRILLNTNALLTPGDIVRIEGKIRIPSTGTNPGNFDYKKYLNDKGISYIAYDPSIVVKVKSSSIISKSVSSLNYYIYRLKTKLFDVFDSNKGIAAAIFTGDKSLVDRSIVNDYRLSGCSHVLAVSGTHFAGFLFVIKKYINRRNSRRKYIIGIYILLALLVCIFTGWSESVTRAAALSVCSILARDRLSGLGLGALIMMLANPYIALSSAFRMSFVVCLSIIYVAPVFKEKLGDTIAIIIACQIGTMPFWITMDINLSIWNVLISMVMSLLAQIACIILVPLLLLSYINSICIYPCSIILSLMNTITKITSSIAISNYQTHNIDRLSYYLIITTVIALIIRPSILRRVMRITSVILFACCFGMYAYSSVNPLLARIVFIDVGQGDSCLIMSKGKSILVDAGTYEQGTTVEGVLDYYGISNVDICIASHWDLDHAGGIIYLQEQGRCKNIYSVTDIPSTLRDEYQVNFISNQIKYGDEIELADCSIRSVNSTFNYDENASSMVLLVNIADTSILLTGDIPSEIEQTIIPEVGHINILKAAHHGSKYSSSKELLEYINPDYTVISVGRYNNYGHPNEEALNRIMNVSEVIRTDIGGAVMIDVYKDYYNIYSYISVH